MALLVPKSHRIDFFLEPQTRRPASHDYYSYGYHSEKKPELAKPKVIPWIDLLLTKSVDNPADGSSKADLRYICNLVIQRMRRWKSRPADPLPRRIPLTTPYSCDDLARVVTLTVELEEKELFVDAFGVWSRRGLQEAAPENSYPETFRAVAIALLRYDLESLLPL